MATMATLLSGCSFLTVDRLHSVGPQKCTNTYCSVAKCRSAMP